MEDVVSVKFRAVENHCDDNGSSRGYAFFAVFDGHGGADAAHFAEGHLLDEISRQDGFLSDDDSKVMQAIKNGFVSTHQMMSKAVDTWPRTVTGLPSTAGTTASIAILRNNKLYVAHVGDSAIVIGEQKSKQHDDRFAAHCVTEDHKPESCKERARIEHCGGEVLVKAGVSRVVWKRPRLVKGLRRRSIVTDNIPFLAVARSLGDLWSYNSERDVYIVSPEPDVSVIELDSEKHRCLILASDGIWNMLSADDAVDYVWRWNRRQQLCRLKSSETLFGSGITQQPAAGLVRLALDRWLVRGIRADNISAIVVLFHDSDSDIHPSFAGLDSKTKYIARNYRSSTSRTIGPAYRQAKASQSRFSRPTLVRAALRKLWRIRAHISSRVTTHGVQSAVLPLGTSDHLQAPPPIRCERSTADLNIEVVSTGVVRPPSFVEEKGAKRRRSYAVACNVDDDDDDDDDLMSQRSSKRFCCDDMSVDTSCCEKLSDFLQLSPSENKLVGGADDDDGQLHETCDKNLAFVVEPSTVHEIIKGGSVRSCSNHSSIKADWSKSHPTCLTRTRLQVQRVCDG
jgi:protein phosphatase 1D